MTVKHLSICAPAAGLPLAASAQEARTGKAVTPRAGPDRDDPRVARFGPGTRLAVPGCTDGFGRCDVIAPDPGGERPGGEGRPPGDGGRHEGGDGRPDGGGPRQPSR